MSLILYCTAPYCTASGVVEICVETELYLAETKENYAAPNKYVERKAISTASAYVCFTSGSTGNPKAVLCRHESLVAFQKNSEVRLFAEPGVSIAQTLSPAFDGSIHEIFSTLSYGATLVLSDPEGPAFENLKVSQSVIFTPSLANALEPSDYPNLRNIYMVGEALSQATSDAWIKGGNRRVYNMYGPSEGTGGATIKRLQFGTVVNLGTPNPSSRVYVLDRHRRLLPNGLIGEIFLSGIQVATGYVNNAAATTRSFFEDPFYADKGCSTTMYKTGDRGYWTTDGQLVCLGRKDRQIKHKGYRLDLQDLEDRIFSKIATVKAVALLESKGNLILFIQPATINVSEVKIELSRLFPSYSRPAVVVPLEQFPLTKPGKLDLARLRQISLTYLKRNKSVSPDSTITESQIVACWREQLNLGADIHIDKSSNFIALGGTSLLQLSMRHSLSKRLDIAVPLKLILGSATLEDLTRTIEDIRPASKQLSTCLIPELGYHGVSPIEETWLYQYQTSEETACFNVTAAWELESTNLDIQKLIQAWDIVLGRHYILRAYFVKQADCFEKLYHANPPKAAIVDELDIQKSANEPFNPFHDFLVRVELSLSHMFLSISHIICDLTTLRVLLAEVATLYNDQALSPNPRSYSNSRWPNEVATEELAFWKAYLPASCTSKSKAQTPAPQCIQEDGISHLLQLPSGYMAKMVELTTTTGLILQQLALTAVGVACASLRPSERPELDIVLGCPHLNRGYEDYDTVGLFLEPLPVRIAFEPELSGHDTLAHSFLKVSQHSIHQALSHAIPWTQLKKHISVGSEAPALFDTMVTIHDNRNRSGGLLNLPWSKELVCWGNGAKFPLMCEFTSLDDHKLLLRLEYKREFLKCGPELFTKVLLEALNGIVMNRGMNELLSSCRTISASILSGFVVKSIPFGTKVADL